MLWWWIACAAPPEPPARRPVVLVTLDTTRADHLGCYGGAADTPNLDALAARGARFARAHAAVPLTIPSHSSLFTGLWPPRHGVRDNGDYRLAEAALTLAERFRAGGYQTHAAVGAFVTQARWGFGQGFDGYDEDLGVPADRLGWRAERRADAVVDDALAALARGADFLWVHLFDAHAPYRAPGAPEGQSDSQAYDAELSWMDTQLGRLLDAVPADAFVVVAGDHGEALGEGGERQHGMLLGDGVLRVPLVVAGPGVAPAVITRPVSLVDVAPTLVRLAGLPPGEFDGTDLFAPSPRAGVYAETRYGRHHFGWTPLEAVITEEGTLVRGAREEGQVSAAALAMLDAVAATSPAWHEAAATLELAEIEQLQALGYLGTATGPAETGVDPRDGIARLRELEGIADLTVPEQEAALRELLGREPAMRDARFRLAALLASQGRVDDAISELSTAFRDQPDSTAALALGGLWLQAADPAEALDWFAEALARDPTSAEATAGQIEALAALGRRDEALALADLALGRQPDHAGLVLARAWLALGSGEAVDPWVEPVCALARVRPYEPRVAQLAGLLLAARGDLEPAVEMLRQELRWRPGNVAAREDLAALFREQGRLVDVVKTLRPLLSLQPRQPRWQALTAQAYLDMGRPDLARPHLDACAGYEGCPR